MAFKTSSQIRQEFLDFFGAKNHAIVSSSPVVPADDPTLLFTNAGMNQFKPLFLGEQKTLSFEGKEWMRAANTQKCIRVSGKHNDLEEVGHDTYHHTLFEMLGNWSFGDYFKEEAIAWAWELLVDRWELDPSRLYATVFGGDQEDGLEVDQEAIDLWKSHTNIDHAHILKCGKKDNFWEMGETGPCGPCSEIHIDLRSDQERAELDGASLVNKDDPRVMEIWNLVFIQFNRLKSGELQTLPAKHVDTGMGFERICAVMQAKTSNYDSDVFSPLIQAISNRAGIRYGDDEYTDIAVRVIADHIRAVAFSVADGASPSNDGRGYVVRRILRRAIRYAWDRLGIKEPFLFELVQVLGQQFSEVFPELVAQQAYIEKVVHSEEKSFIRTLGQGIALFEQMTEHSEVLTGEDAFKLHDTYGFPIDLTQLMAREKGLRVDVAGFDERMNEQKTRARAAGAFSVDHNEKGQWSWVAGKETQSEFVGYDELRISTSIIAYREVEDTFHLLLEKNPFYAEGGGQVSDKGLLKQLLKPANHNNETDQEFAVIDVQKSPYGSVLVVQQLPALDQPVEATVNRVSREFTCANHSATHLLQAALITVLGPHVAQKGSLVNQDYLRFDFTHFEAMTKQQLLDVQALVNEKIRAGIPLEEDREIPIEQAKERGARMLFGEKYGDKVRVITFDSDYSMELCGGTHVQNTGEIGFFKIVHESSVAAGIRRIEALTAFGAEQWVTEQESKLQTVANLLGTSNEFAESIERLQADKKELERKVEVLVQAKAIASQQALMNTAEQLDNGIKWVCGHIESFDMDTIKNMGYSILNESPKMTVSTVFTHDEDSGKVFILATVTEDLIQTGLKAGAIVGKLGRIIGGGGGGQPSLATAGGSKPEAIPEAITAAKSMLTD
ncbi:MAG: alanine--tRNA ligase [Rhodothermaeota bacterium MED-G12]|nr:MAG: alanine--tRNA ligase [Rhodothermaeota bacterium MED-G12]CAI8370124.1 MAG: Alanine--tRNA ligase [Rhodothermaeota bacterium MED-G12]